MKSDIEIALEAKLKPITEIAAAAGIKDEALEPYGKYKAKLSPYNTNKQDGQLILVTAINPTAAGEGKTTVSIGLADGLRQIGAKSMLALREPSLGPVFGVKGGAAGGGYAQVAPMQEINLHFTGDFHAITSANNLLAALIDNHIYYGNKLNIKTITWKRCLDMNDRALREITIGLEIDRLGCVRKDGFTITAASEMMAILCLATNFDDLKKRLGRIIIGYNTEGSPVFADDLNASESLALLLWDAYKPNLVQTLEGTPALIHGGPFANIAHGCNSVIATKTALSLADYVVTEAGFGADLGAEKFLDIKCRLSGLAPSCVVIVATVRALKMHGGKDKAELGVPDIDALRKGMPNLKKHIHNVTKVFGLRAVVAINRFSSDSQEEIDEVINACKEMGVAAVPCTVWADGGKGAIKLAQTVKAMADQGKQEYNYTYSLDISYAQKIEAIAKNIYGADGVEFSAAAKKSLSQIEKSGFTGLPVCIAKTQYSLSDNAALTAAPSGFKITIREVYLRSGAGFVVAVAGDIMLMPGLPKIPNAEKMTIDSNGVILGLF